MRVGEEEETHICSKKKLTYTGAWPSCCAITQNSDVVEQHQQNNGNHTAHSHWHCHLIGFPKLKRSLHDPHQLTYATPRCCWLSPQCCCYLPRRPSGTAYGQLHLTECRTASPLTVPSSVMAKQGSSSAVEASVPLHRAAPRTSAGFALFVRGSLYVKLHEGRSTGVAPRGPPAHGDMVAVLFHTDVRSILMLVLLAIKGTNAVTAYVSTNSFWQLQADNAGHSHRAGVGGWTLGITHDGSGGGDVSSREMASEFGQDIENGAVTWSLFNVSSLPPTPPAPPPAPLGPTHCSLAGEWLNGNEKFTATPTPGLRNTYSFVNPDATYVSV